MRTIYEFCQQMVTLYAMCRSRLGEYTYFRNLWHSTANEQFVNLICKSVDIKEFKENVIKHNEEMKKYLEHVKQYAMENGEYDLHISFENEDVNILNTHVILTPLFKEEHYRLLTPIRDTYVRFGNFYAKYTNKESPAILGNNWKLQKIFNNCKATKNKELKREYILDPTFIDEIINNYFLYVKCGWNPNE